MEDEAILELYAQRDEAALAETTQKFSGLCKQLAMRILGNAHDADECFDDMLLKVWNAIPPAHPLPFAPYLATLIRHICIDRYHAENTLKRGGGQISAALEELEECVAAQEDVEKQVDTAALREAINRFLGTLPQETRILFMERYYLMTPFAEIANKHDVGVSKVKMSVARTREKLQKYLAKEGLL